MKQPGAFSIQIVLRLGLFAAQTFFLWMFFVAGGLERLAELGFIHGPAGVNVRAVAFDFAARWRHGMTDGWLLYMPGFYATALALWRRAIGLSLRSIVTECAATGVLAAIAALLLAPSGANLLLNEFHAQTGLRCAGEWPGVAGRVIGQGIFTLVNWNSFVLASQFAITRKSLRPLLVPAVLSVVLVLIRPFTAGDFMSLWGQRFRLGDPVAVFSALLIPFLAALLGWDLLRSRRPWNAS